MASPKNITQIPTRTQLRRISLLKRNLLTSFSQIHRRRRLGINLGRQRLTKEPVLARIHLVVQQVGLLVEVDFQVVLDLVPTSTSRIYLKVSLVADEADPSVVIHSSKRRCWLETASRSIQVSRSWKPRMVPAKLFTSPP